MKYLLLVVFITGLFFTGCGNDEHDHEQDKKYTYTCPMHPQIIQDKPGVCPICHMDLVIKPDASTDSVSTIDSIIDIGSNEVVLANLKTIVIKRDEIKREVRAYSIIDFAEDSRKTISARFNGRIEKLYADKSGVYIRKGEPLFEIYSPELIQAQNDLLISGTNEALFNAAKEKLILFGISEKQISVLLNEKKLKNSVTYYSPYSGTVLEKKIREGMYVTEGTAMYEIAEFSTVWNIADVFESDLGAIKPGSNVKYTIQAYPGEVFSGKVNLVYPVVDPQNRTVKVRSVINNTSGKLKPNMYGETLFELSSRSGITVPAEAILMTGSRNIVYVKAGKGKFQAREVKIGTKINGSYEVLSGLNENDEIAYSGAYLIDSESQLRGITK